VYGKHLGPILGLLGRGGWGCDNRYGGFSFWHGQQDTVLRQMQDNYAAANIVQSGLFLGEKTTLETRLYLTAILLC
jgi:hypothetical protein